MRDLNRILIAEDDVDRAREMREIMETIGGRQAWVTKRVSGIMPLLQQTDAGWLILDMELEDGNSTEVIGEIRSKYGQKVLILVLTGYWERFGENLLFKKGADVVLRKPYSPQELLMQMNKLEALQSGLTGSPTDSIVLRVGDGLLDLDTGIFIKGDGERVDLPETHLKLVRFLASDRTAMGWRPVPRGDILLHIWGDTLEIDAMTAGSRLRKLAERIRDFLGGKDIINVSRTRTHGSKYALSNDITIHSGGEVNA